MSDQIDPSVAATPSDADSSPAMMDPSASPPAAQEAATDPIANEPAIDHPVEYIHPLAYLGGEYRVLADYIVALEAKVAKAMGWA